MDYSTYICTNGIWGKILQLFWILYPIILYISLLDDATNSVVGCIIQKRMYAYHEKYNGPSGSNSITFVPRWQIWLRFFGNRIDSSCFYWCLKFRSCLFFLFKVGQIPFPGNHGLPTFPKLNESSGWKKTSRFWKKKSWEKIGACSTGFGSTSL